MNQEFKSGKRTRVRRAAEKMAELVLEAQRLIASTQGRDGAVITGAVMDIYRAASDQKNKNRSV